MINFMILHSPSMEPALLPLLLLPLLVLPAEADYCDLAQQHTLCAHQVRLVIRVLSL